MSAIKPAANVAQDSRLAAIVRLAVGAVVTLVYVLVNLPLARADNVDGAWTDVHDWPLIAVHAALTPDGRVLSYG
ncbi:MAG: hypothetical protein HKN35_07195, partial [Woeseia sp.]|nr:hypothetical protein [Woeseia sp.]